MNSSALRVGLLLLQVGAGIGLANADEPAGEQVFAQSCAACHTTGALNAPVISQPAQWQQRLEQPLEILQKHAIEGINGMPAKGGNSSLDDTAVRQAVVYMVEQIRAIDAAPPQASKEPEVNEALALSPTRILVEHIKGDTPYHQPPGDEQIPNDKYGDEVRLGKKIFTETWSYARRYAGNDLTCSNCHLDAGRKANAAPMWAAFGMYPTYRRKNDRNTTLEERIQDCFRFSMNGFAPALDAPEIRALVSYFHFLAKGVPIGIEAPGRGFPQVVSTGQDPNPTRGGHVYKAKCALCHGEDGSGQRKEGGGYLYPPVWGMGSYNKGAGLARVGKLAGFLKANMPLGADFSLSDQEALDLAAFINLQIRPWDPRKGIIEGLLE